MTMTDDNTTSMETRRPSELAFAEALVAGGKDFAGRWVEKSDQTDNPGRLLAWARAVVGGVHRTQAPHWYVASPAWCRWMDAQEPSSASEASRGVADAPTEAPGPGDFEAAVTAVLQRMARHLEELTTYAAVTPGRYHTLQREAAALTSDATELGRRFTANTADGS